MEKKERVIEREEGMGLEIARDRSNLTVQETNSAVDKICCGQFNFEPPRWESYCRLQDLHAINSDGSCFVASSFLRQPSVLRKGWPKKNDFLSVT